jgi:TetR/AcrR family transcriptional repressor of nem operon
MARPRQFDEAAVLDRAMNLFWKQGFHGTSMQDLVDHLEISRASLYQTFGNKDALFQLALERYRQQNLVVVREFLAKQPSAWEGLRRLFINSVEQSLTDDEQRGCLAVNATTELASHQAKIMAWLLDNQASFERIYADQVRAAQQAGDVPHEIDPETAAAYLFTLNCGLKVVAKLKPDLSQLTGAIDLGLASLRQPPTTKADGGR